MNIIIVIFIININIWYMHILKIFSFGITWIIRYFKTIFFSCDRCHRPGVFIKGKLEEKEDPKKVYGTINVVDTIIYNCINTLNLATSEGERERSKNNIILYDKSYTLYKYENLKSETDGAFIIVTNEVEFDKLIEEINLNKNNYKFDLIIIGNEASKIIKRTYFIKSIDNIIKINLYNWDL